MYGRTPILPLDYQENDVTISHDSEHEKKLNQFLTKLNKQARINIIKNQERYKQRYGTNRSDPSYNVGDLILVKTLNIHSKFNARYEGPFRIIENLIPKTFIVQHIKKPTLHRQVTTDVLLPICEQHYYALNYPPFEPSSYELIFINYRTIEETLIQLIKIINSSTLFIMDTESVCAYKKPNKPALIQVQIITHQLNSYILIIEAYHLPRPHVSTFTLIQQLFESLFQT
ncbi:unnamed protein product [Rotaria sordida]|uniref:Uncharacterized protein n=1 Tax=Rotaria sordida TaxID=392033 RepID=A0A815J9F6_9BILA|nr:unnamed protein product [Rotaria sordida]CAF1613382.1 unnamed protein product [Rotaria sordida]